MGRGTKLGLVASLAIISSPVAASGDPLAAIWPLFDEGRDLSAVEQLRALAFRKDGSVANPLAEDMWEQLSPRLEGLAVAAPIERGDARKPAAAEDIAAVQSAERRDAIDTIVDRARDRRIVILNEEHDAPEDRAFGLAVAKALRPLGFTMLAAEAFTNDKDPANTDVTALAARGYPIRKTGTYIGDPVFGDFVRQALALGYKPIAYEETAEQRSANGGDRIDRREEAEASNLTTAILRAPQTKFLIYVGYSHATEMPIREEDNEKVHLWMAGRLKQKTGLDPLTIDQTGLGAENPLQSSRLLRGIVQRQGISRPVILFSGGKPLPVGRYRDAIDLQVIHPVTHVIHGRPDWLLTMGRHPVRPAPNLVPKTGKALVQAFLSSEGSDAVPVDQAVLEPGDTRWFMLPDKPVRFVVKESFPASAAVP